MCQSFYNRERKQSLYFLVKILVLFTLALLPKPAFSHSCEELFKEPSGRFGSLDQNDSALRRARLFPAGQLYSQLCGPTCFVNSLHAIREWLDLPHRQSTGELIYLSKKVVREIGLTTKQLRYNGMAAYELADLIRVYLHQIGIKAKVTTKGVEVNSTSAKPSGKAGRSSISLNDLQPMYKKIVIVNYEGWRTKQIDLIEATVPSTGWLGGHYVLAETLDMSNLTRATMTAQDPRKAVSYPLELEPFDSSGLGIQTLRVAFPPVNGRPSDSTILELVTNVVIIEID